MIKTGKHYKLISKITHAAMIGAIASMGVCCYSAATLIADSRHQTDIVNALNYDEYVAEQTEIIDSQLENNEISQDEYKKLKNELDDTDGFVKRVGTPLQVEYYNKVKSDCDKSLASVGISLAAMFATGMTAVVLEEIAISMEKKYAKYLENHPISEAAEKE